MNSFATFFTAMAMLLATLGMIADAQTVNRCGKRCLRVFTDRDQLDDAIDSYRHGIDPDVNRWCFAATLTDFGDLFMDQDTFNYNIGCWDTSHVTDMNEMFYYATSFNKDISLWDVSKVTDMHNMFLGAESFNKDISKWDVSGVTNMVGMFNDATAFNKGLANWDVSSVEEMNKMFDGATAFNRDISKWDVSNVVNMFNMFNGATAFKQNLCAWGPKMNDGVNFPNVGSMFDDTSCASEGEPAVNGMNIVLPLCKAICV